MKESQNKAELAPINPKQRIVEIDMIRGFALFGVLFVSMFNFGADSLIWDLPSDRFITWFMELFFEEKSWHLFTMLFAFGFGLQLLRAENRIWRFFPIYLRRLFILFLFGMFNHLMKFDVLMLYAQLGLLLIFFRKFSFKALIIIAGVIILLLGLFLGYKNYVGKLEFYKAGNVLPSHEQHVQEAQTEAEELLRSHTYAIGSFKDIIKFRMNNLWEYNIINPLWGSLQNIAIFLIGLAIMKTGIHNHLKEKRKKILKFTIIALILGLIGSSVPWLIQVMFWHNRVWPPTLLLIPMLLIYPYGATFFSLGYAGMIVLMANNNFWKPVVKPLASVGRMALTVYITQGMMMAVFFYNYGLGYYYKAGPMFVFLVSITFFIIQIIGCNIWMKYFKFGPFEWLWRSLTYWKIQPFRNS